MKSSKALLIEHAVAKGLAMVQWSGRAIAIEGTTEREIVEKAYKALGISKWDVNEIVYNTTNEELYQ